MNSSKTESIRVIRVETKSQNLSSCRLLKTGVELDPLHEECVSQVVQQLGLPFPCKTTRRPAQMLLELLDVISDQLLFDAQIRT